MQSPSRLIDLSADTATRPSEGMRQAIATAPVGDEQRGEDPTTLALEARVADLLGQEKALFLPSGTMANQIAFLVHCRPGDEIVCAENAHVFGSEGAGAAALAGAQFRPVDTATGIFTAEDVACRLRALRHRSPRSRVITIEQTTNRGGGRIWPEEAILALKALAMENGLALHMDGARLMNAAVATGLPAARFAAPCDSVWIDLSKGLGCPVGAVLAGPAAFIEEALVWKHRLGGAMRQSGILAAAGLYALDHNVERLAEDHDNARRLAAMLGAVPGLKLQPEGDVTNILFLDLAGTGVSARALAEALLGEAIRVNVEGTSRIRMVTHLDVSAADVEIAGRTIVAALARLRPDQSDG
jgi:threonine aldolase